MTTMEGITTGSSTDTHMATTSTTGIGTAEGVTGAEASGSPFSPTRITRVTTAIRTTATVRAIIPATVIKEMPRRGLRSQCAVAGDSRRSYRLIIPHPPRKDRSYGNLRPSDGMSALGPGWRPPGARGASGVENAG